MDEKILYGSDEYARDCWAMAEPYEGVFPCGERTTGTFAGSTSEAFRGEGGSRSGEALLTVSELAQVRRLDGMSVAREKLSKVLNRTWQNDEVSYPLYGILREQRDRETAYAVGRAYMGATVRAHGSEASDTFGAVTSAHGRPSATEWYVAVRQMVENQGKERKDT